MTTSPAIDALADIKSRIADAAREDKRSAGDVTLIAVSKTFNADAITTVLEVGHRVFGENRVQEAKGKWPELKARYPDIALHLIGPLQSNKAKEAVELFDAIHSIDREKIAKAIADEMSKQGKMLQLFVQVNTGEEPQKAGVMPREAKAFVEMCQTELGLKIEGLMCIPPVEDEPGVHFAFLDKLARECGLAGRSMGMSSDYETAVKFGATHVRVGSAIFGAR